MVVMSMSDQCWISLDILSAHVYKVSNVNMQTTKDSGVKLVLHFN